MSFDLQYVAICDHRTQLETHWVGKDRRTVTLPVPALRSNFHVYMNGYQVLPNDPIFGWNLEVDTSNPTPRYLKLVFNNDLRTYDNFFQLSYQTTESNCRRCRGLRIYNDISLGPTGLLNTVVDENKLVQDLKKGVLTILGSNRYASWYGTGLVTLIGTKVLNNNNLVQLKMQQEVSQFVNSLMQLQLKQSQYQTVTLRELIYQILGIQTAATDPTGSSWQITVSLTNRAGNQAAFTQPIDKYSTQSLPTTSSEPFDFS